jgi:hypothetical protein
MPTTAPTAFNSVKLPASLVSEAKQAAITMRRSTAGQIEYWVMLGKAVEAGGLTVREVAQALEGEAPQKQSHQVDQLLSQYTQFEASGALAQHVRSVIAAQAARAQPLAA